MKYLIKSWPSCKKTLENKPLALFLDFDGTLAPIAPTPDKAVIVQNNKILLEELSKSKQCAIAIVSGRALEDVKEKVGIKGIVYVGNHGLEIEGPQIHFESLMPPNLKNNMDQIKDDLASHLSAIPGVFIEDKGLTLSIHYRLVNEKDLPAVQKIFIKICEPYHQRKEIKIGSGKKVLEVRPPIAWNKGHAVTWLLKQYELAQGQTAVPLYIGDDTTDEDAFAILKKIGLTVIVGKQASQARYYLENTPEVTWVLKQILPLVTSKNLVL